MSRNITSFRRFVSHVPVEQRSSDGYVNATSLCKAYYASTGQRREVSEWLSNARTQEMISHLSSKTGIPVSQLVESRKGKSRKFRQGTWIHPRLSVRFGIWLSDEFGYLVEEWVQEWLTTGRNPIQSDPNEEWVSHQQRYDIRIHLKDVLRPELMNAVVAWAESHNKNPRTLCSNVHDTMNERIQGAKSKQIGELGGLPLGVLIRDYFDASPLVQYSAINKLAINAIVDKGTEPVLAVHDACDAFLGKSYVPRLVPIAENLYSQRQRVSVARRRRALAQGVQLSLPIDTAS